MCSALEEADKELLENNRVERSHIEEEINELRARNVSINQSINQSKHISIAPYVASESEAHMYSEYL